MSENEKPEPAAFEHRVAKVSATTFIVPKDCEEKNCPKRATRGIVFTSDDEALPTKQKFLCRHHLQKMIDHLSEQMGAMKDETN